MIARLLHLPRRLIVEPRLDGVVVIADPRNPAECVGRRFAFGELCFHEQMVWLDRSSPSYGKHRLRFAWSEVAGIARRASRRQLRRRIRGGTYDEAVTIPPPPSKAWLILGVLLALGIVASITASPWLGWNWVAWQPLPAATATLDRLLLSGFGLVFSGVMSAIVAVSLPNFFRNVGHLRLTSEMVEARLLDGRIVAAPWTEVIGIDDHFSVTRLRLSDGPVLTIPLRTAHGTLRAIARGYPHLRSAGWAGFRRTLIRIGVLWTLGCFAIGVVLYHLWPHTGVRGPIVPHQLGNAILTALIAWVGLPVALGVMFGGAIVLPAWLLDRGHRKKKLGRKVRRRHQAARALQA